MLPSFSKKSICITSSPIAKSSTVIEKLKMVSVVIIFTIEQLLETPRVPCQEDVEIIKFTMPKSHSHLIGSP